MGYYDPRDPETVASSIVASVKEHLHDQTANATIHKPLLIITQGDPLAPRGISAITPIVANALSNAQRGLVCLDEHIADYHSKNADRNNVVLEVKYSQLLKVLEEAHGKPFFDKLENAVEAHISQQNKERAMANKPPVKDYFKTFAMLQEVTKASLQHICTNITIAHTSKDINPWSVTSFYKIGLDLGLYRQSDIVGYNTSTQFQVQEEPLDFTTIDPRWRYRKRILSWFEWKLSIIEARPQIRFASQRQNHCPLRSSVHEPYSARQNSLPPSTYVWYDNWLHQVRNDGTTVELFDEFFGPLIPSTLVQGEEMEGMMDAMSGVVDEDVMAAVETVMNLENDESSACQVSGTMIGLGMVSFLLSFFAII